MLARRGEQAALSPRQDAEESRTGAGASRHSQGNKCGAVLCGGVVSHGEHSFVCWRMVRIRWMEEVQQRMQALFRMRVFHKCPSGVRAGGAQCTNFTPKLKDFYAAHAVCSKTGAQKAKIVFVRF